MRLTGVLVALSYQMGRHRAFGLPWLAWLLLLPVGLFLAMMFHLLELSWWGLTACSLAFLAGVILLVHGRGGWLATTRDAAPSPAECPALSLGKRVPLRATGWFTTREMRRRYVAVAGYYETFETREHVVMLKLAQTRFFLFGKSPEEEVGWWYTFFCPEHVLEITPVRQAFGAADLPALRLLLRPEPNKPPEPLLLAFASEAERERVWGDLRRDVGAKP